MGTRTKTADLYYIDALFEVGFDDVTVLSKSGRFTFVHGTLLIDFQALGYALFTSYRT